jgi:hypothetical protein
MAVTEAPDKNVKTGKTYSVLTNRFVRHLARGSCAKPSSRTGGVSIQKLCAR